MPQLMALYRDLHANPELSMQEVRTPAKLAPEMRKLGFDVTEHVGKTGVVAVLRNGPGPVLLIRADMDALAGHRTDRPAVRLEGHGQAAATASRPRSCTPAATTRTSPPGSARRGAWSR